MARLTLRDHILNKVQFRLEHHPDFKGATTEDLDDDTLVTTATGAKILVGERIDWLRDAEGELVSRKGGGLAISFLTVLNQDFWTVNTDLEMEDLVCELYRIQILDGCGPIEDCLRKAFVLIGLGEVKKIGFRGRRQHHVIPEGLLRKLQHQYSHFLEHGKWDFGKLDWYPLRELVLLVDPTPNADIVFSKQGRVEGARRALYEHFLAHKRLATHYATELLRRIEYLDEYGQWPEVSNG